MDIEKYLEPVSGASPCGNDLGYDAQFREMELAFEGKPERQMGNEVLASEEPDWRKAEKLASELAEKTRDVRVATILTQSLIHTSGIEGLVNGLRLNHGLLESFWDCVYPQQDPEDDYPISRLNALMALGKSDGLVKHVRDIPLVDAKGVGRFSLRDVDIAQGRIKAKEEDNSPASEAVISAAFTKVTKEASEKENLEKKAKLVVQGLQILEAMTHLLIEKTDAANVPDFSALQDTLQSINKVYEKYLPANMDAEDDHTATSSSQSSSVETGGIIRNRDEALEMIDRVCDYFDLYEPSSPVPYILRRARRLANKDFMQILEDMVPESVTQAESITGSGNKE